VEEEIQILQPKQSKKTRKSTEVLDDVQTKKRKASQSPTRRSTRLQKASEIQMEREKKALKNLRK